MSKSRQQAAERAWVSNPLQSGRFDVEYGLRVAVQVPARHVPEIVAAVLKHDELTYGDYDRVRFVSAPGEQGFRSLGGGHNARQENDVTVECAELSFFLTGGDNTAAVIEAIYDAHPYEEPVILVIPCRRCLHVRGTDEDNPARFWNRDDADWLPRG